MKSFFENAAAYLVSTGLHWLHNRSTPAFSREEIRHLRLSFSQFGEDIGLQRWFDEHFKITRGIYVDVGAYHPIQFSNTLLLHKNGWRGVNIDMNADKISMFKQLRPDDVNVHSAVSNSQGWARSKRSGLVEEMEEDPHGTIPVRPLNDILSETSFQKIDYLNIDCEGHDFEVLQSVDLDSYQPKVITIEALGQAEEFRLRDYLVARSYAPKEVFHYTTLFVREI